MIYIVGVFNINIYKIGKYLGKHLGSPKALNQFNVSREFNARPCKDGLFILGPRGENKLNCISISHQGWDSSSNREIRWEFY